MEVIPAVEQLPCSLSACVSSVQFKEFVKMRDKNGSENLTPNGIYLITTLVLPSLFVDFPDSKPMGLQQS